jgi:chemotaxis receptor (MCP) glutamine deamidase CheD
MGSKAATQRHLVPTGSFVISNRKNEIIDAYLGTCVGVTLCDRQANVGGLIHLLLPEPMGSEYMGKRENYALTGLPVFLQALCKEGASLERLEASVAGGALVGPLSETDTDLDIGGRTVEIIKDLLHKGGSLSGRTRQADFSAADLALT